eukprot:scaffold897_cov402-Prasinococcus_capsulatus_cf.AAC.17
MDFEKACRCRRGARSAAHAQQALVYSQLTRAAWVPICREGSWWVRLVSIARAAQRHIRTGTACTRLRS